MGPLQGEGKPQVTLPSHGQGTVLGPRLSPEPPSYSIRLPGQDADTVRHHVILGEALSVETLQRGGHRNSLLGPAHWLVFYNHSGQVCGGGGLGVCNLCSRDQLSRETPSPPPASP